MRILPAASLILAALCACDAAASDDGPANVPGTEPTAAAAGTPHEHADTAFAALQQRGHTAMGVDQYTSVHRFDALPDGGRIELQRDRDDPAGVATIREHLQSIVRAFSTGDFSTPGFVHMREMPGTRVMAERRDRIRYEFHPLPRGGEVRITTTDPEAIAAIHAFMAAQRGDHRAGEV